MTSTLLMDKAGKGKPSDLPEISTSKPFQEEKPRRFKAESITPAPRNMPSVAPQHRSAADSLAKFSTHSLAICMGTVCIGGLSGIVCEPALLKHRVGSSEKLFPEQSGYQKDKQPIYLGSQLSSILRRASGL